MRRQKTQFVTIISPIDVMKFSNTIQLSPNIQYFAFSDHNKLTTLSTACNTIFIILNLSSNAARVGTCDIYICGKSMFVENLQSIMARKGQS